MSKLTEAQLKKLGVDELKRILVDQYKEELIGDEKKSDLIAMILDHQNSPAVDGETGGAPAVVGDDSGSEDEAETPAAVTEKAPSSKKQKRDPHERVWLKVFNDDSPTGTQDVFLAVNDDNVMIKRERWVHVKMLHVRALGRAMETHYRREKDEYGKEIQKAVNVRRYKFDVRPGGPKDMPEDSESEVDSLAAMN